MKRNTFCLLVIAFVIIQAFIIVPYENRQNIVVLVMYVATIAICYWAGYLDGKSETK